MFVKPVVYAFTDSGKAIYFGGKNKYYYEYNYACFSYMSIWSGNFGVVVVL